MTTTKMEDEDGDTTMVLWYPGIVIDRDAMIDPRKDKSHYVWHGAERIIFSRTIDLYNGDTVPEGAEPDDYLTGHMLILKRARRSGYDGKSLNRKHPGTFTQGGHVKHDRPALGAPQIITTDDGQFYAIADGHAVLCGAQGSTVGGIPRRMNDQMAKRDSSGVQPSRWPVCSQDVDLDTVLKSLEIDPSQIDHLKEKDLSETQLQVYKEAKKMNENRKRLQANMEKRFQERQRDIKGKGKANQQQKLEDFDPSAPHGGLDSEDNDDGPSNTRYHAEIYNHSFVGQPPTISRGWVEWLNALRSN